MTDNTLRVSMVQMHVTNDKSDNVDRAVEHVRTAATEGADLAVLPENFSFFGTDEELFDQAETLDGPTLTRLGDVAAELGVHVVAGTMKLRKEGQDKLVNASVHLTPDGEIENVYEKVHIFNAEVGGESYEGDTVEVGGDDVVVTDIEGVSVGMTVCFDVRFPELYRILALRGAEVILVPSLFTMYTGKDHWEPLLKARAIENQTYVVAPDVVGQYPPHDNRSYGRSLAVDPWGLVVAHASDQETVVTFDVDTSVVEDTRSSVPTLSQRRPDAYRWPDN